MSRNASIGGGKARSVRWALLLAAPLVPLTGLLAQAAPLAGRWDRVRLVHDAVRYDIALSLPDTGGRIAATVTTRWRLGGAAPLVLDLDSAMTVRRVTVNGAPVRWHREGNRIAVPVSGARGDTITTEVGYDGAPRDGLVFRGAAGARTIFADNWPDRARFWLAAQDHPADKAAVTWRIEAPAGYRVVANGRLEGVDTLPSGRLSWRYRNDEPIPTYTMVAGMARFATTILPAAACGIRCVPVSVLTYPTDSARAMDGPFRRSGEIVAFFSGRFGPFPYGELRHVESSTRFGGMENATAIFYDEKAMHAGTMTEGTVAHETAHQWFGDAVTETDWHHIWLSEGFATYGAALWAEHEGGDSGLRAAMAANRASVLASPATERPILDSTITERMKLLNTNSYQKGAWVLHTLRGLMGDEAFFRGLARYYRTHAQGNALSSDFASIMGLEAGRDLGWYFRQALTQPGYPILAATTELDGGHLVLTIRQTQPAAWGVYRMPNLKVRLGSRVLTVDISERVTRLATHWEDDGPPKSVELDPDGWWLFRPTGGT
jgi:aminopeptidase N